LTINFTVDLAFDVLCVAVALGAGLAIHFMRGPAVPRPAWPIPLAHGVVGAAGLAVLLAVLQRGPTLTTSGTTGFGPAAALLLGLALALGLSIAYMASRRRRPASVLVAVHASLAIAGFVMLWTLVSLG
jgi:hypothetical protein